MILLICIVFLPFLGFLINGLLNRRLQEKTAQTLACLFPLLSFLLALKASYYVFTQGPLNATLFTWASISTFSFPVSLTMDGLSAIMTLIVTGVGTLIHYYSTAYMSHDEGQRRFFAYLNLFLFFMLLLVLAKNLLVLFVGWEGVGLASYLLIGFWFQDEEKAIAGKKAFLFNRIGDAGFLIGIFLLFSFVGDLDLMVINQWFNAQTGSISSFMINLIGLALFLGAAGKSAQIPLYVWLPDAMAGPTPVSALIHAATMVTAGVYMVARLSGLYVHAELALTVMAFVGAFTALLAASIALAQRDIKKILAYSTVSQLGLMFVALGVGAFSTAIFHVFTHAFFKACLFLAAGAVIHSLHEEQDIFKMGGLFKKMPVTAITMLIATISIAGLPPFSGFFSKDEILWTAYASSRGGLLLWALCAFTSLLTSFYMFRLFFVTFLGKPRHTQGEGIHEAPFAMNSVLVVLALGSAFAGFLNVPAALNTFIPIPPLFENALHSSLAPFASSLHDHGQELLFMGLSVLIALFGLLLSFFIYKKDLSLSETLALRFHKIHKILLQKYYVDEAYDFLIMKPLRFLSTTGIRDFFDKRLLDGFLHFLANGSQSTSSFLGRLQNGKVQFYLLFVLVGLFLALSWSLYYV